MPAGFPEWPGPRDAEAGITYTREHPNPQSDANVFVVTEITEDDGAVTVTGRFETR